MVSMIFGSPGSGKSTVATMLCRKAKRPVYTNISGIQSDNVEVITDDEVRSLGEWSPPAGSLIVVDECGIIFNGRHWKSFPRRLNEYMRKHRHYKVDVIYLSQGWEDVDKTLRDLCVELYYIRSIGPLSMWVKVKKATKVDKQTEQIIDGYAIVSPLWLLFKPLKLLMLHKLFPQIDYYRFCLRPRYYKFFDSYAAEPLPDLYSWRDEKEREAAERSSS